MVSIAVSKLGCSDTFFVEPGVKVKSAYYRDVLLKQQMLLVIRRMSGDFIFQQDSAPARHAQETIELLRRKAIGQWRPRLRACGRAKGKHFEQLLN